MFDLLFRVGQFLLVVRQQPLQPFVIAPQPLGFAFGLATLTA